MYAHVQHYTHTYSPLDASDLPHNLAIDDKHHHKDCQEIEEEYGTVGYQQFTDMQQVCGTWLQYKMGEKKLWFKECIAIHSQMIYYLCGMKGFSKYYEM